jgi:hypothetical protein
LISNCKFCKTPIVGLKKKKRRRRKKKKNIVMKKLEEAVNGFDSIQKLEKTIFVGGSEHLMANIPKWRSANKNNIIKINTCRYVNKRIVRGSRHRHEEDEKKGERYLLLKKNIYRRSVMSAARRSSPVSHFSQM